MPRGNKSSFTEKKRRKAEQIEEAYEKLEVVKDGAESRAWARAPRRAAAGTSRAQAAVQRTRMKAAPGGRKSGSGRNHAERSVATKKGLGNPSQESRLSSVAETEKHKGHVVMT